MLKLNAVLFIGHRCVFHISELCVSCEFGTVCRECSR